MSDPVLASPNFDLQAAMEAVKKARAEGVEAGRAAFAADLREQGEVTVPRQTLESVRATTNDHHIYVLMCELLGGEASD